jgi:hypothetical protein
MTVGDLTKFYIILKRGLVQMLGSNVIDQGSEYAGWYGLSWGPFRPLIKNEPRQNLLSGAWITYGESWKPLSSFLHLPPFGNITFGNKISFIARGRKTICVRANMCRITESRPHG